MHQASNMRVRASCSYQMETKPGRERGYAIGPDYINNDDSHIESRNIIDATVKCRTKEAFSRAHLNV